MSKDIALEKALANRGCYSKERILELFAGHKYICQYKLLELALSKDVLWFVFHLKLGTAQSRAALLADLIELAVAEYWPDIDSEPRKALEALRAFAVGAMNKNNLGIAASQAYIVANATWEAGYNCDVDYVTAMNIADAAFIAANAANAVCATRADEAFWVGASIGDNADATEIERQQTIIRGWLLGVIEQEAVNEKKRITRYSFVISSDLSPGLRIAHLDLEERRATWDCERILRERGMLGDMECVIAATSNHQVDICAKCKSNIIDLRLDTGGSDDTFYLMCSNCKNKSITRSKVIAAVRQWNQEQTHYNYKVLNGLP